MVGLRVDRISYGSIPNDAVTRPSHGIPMKMVPILRIQNSHNWDFPGFRKTPLQQPGLYRMGAAYTAELQPVLVLRQREPWSLYQAKRETSMTTPIKRLKTMNDDRWNLFVGPCVLPSSVGPLKRPSRKTTVCQLNDRPCISIIYMRMKNVSVMS